MQAVDLVKTCFLLCWHLYCSACCYLHEAYNFQRFVEQTESVSRPVLHEPTDRHFTCDRVTCLAVLYCKLSSV